MIEADLTQEQVLAMPLRDAVQLMAMLVWMAKAAGNPGYSIDDALSVPLSEALELMQQAEG